MFEDLKHALRVYRATPQASAFAVLALAVAMAAICAFLSLWSDLALKGHPGFERNDGLVTIGQTDGQRFVPLSLRLIEKLGAEAATIDSIAGVQRLLQYRVGENGERDELATESVTASFFPALRPRLQLGRGFDEQDHRVGAAPVTVISDRFWRDELGGRDDVIGQTLEISGPNIALRSPDGEGRAAEESQHYRIVGVMSERMTGTYSTPADVWMPFEQSAEALLGGAGDTYKRIAMLLGIARPAGAANAANVRTELNGRRSSSDPEIGMLNGYRFDVERGVVPDVSVLRDAERQVLLFLTGSVLLALVAACNISLFLLSRAPGRRRELGVRLAVGAPVRRLARQLAAEAGALVAASAALGFLISLWLTAFMRDLPFLQRADWRSASPLDWRVLAIVLGVTLLLTLLVSVAPVLGLRRVGIAAASRMVTARPGWVQRLAGAAQLAVAGVIAAAALAFAWYAVSLVTVDKGFEPRGVQVVAIDARGAGGPAPAIEAVAVERERLRSSLAALPGVDAVAFGNSVPGRVVNFTTNVGLSEAPDDRVQAMLVSADPGYVDLLGLRLVDGRNFDSPEQGPVLINETLARRLWDRTDVAGEVLPGLRGPGALQGTEILGVVADAAYDHPSAEVRPLIFLPIMPFSLNDAVLVRTALDAEALRALIQRQIDTGELELEIRSVEPLEEIWGSLLAADLTRTWLATGSALLVVLLAGFGFYGTQRYLVSAGRREYAVRAALGAGPRALGRLVARRGFLLALPGWVLGGLLGAIAVAWLRDGYVSREVSLGAVVALVALGIAGLVAIANAGPTRQVRRAAPAPLLKEE